MNTGMIAAGRLQSPIDSRAGQPDLAMPITFPSPRRPSCTERPETHFPSLPQPGERIVAKGSEGARHKGVPTDTELAWRVACSIGRWRRIRGQTASCGRWCGRDSSRRCLANLAQPVAMVPSTLDGDAVMTQIRANGLQTALVVDEFGGGHQTNRIQLFDSVYAVVVAGTAWPARVLAFRLIRTSNASDTCHSRDTMTGVPSPPKSTSSI